MNCISIQKIDHFQLLNKNHYQWLGKLLLSVCWQKAMNKGLDLVYETCNKAVTQDKNLQNFCPILQLYCVVIYNLDQLGNSISSNSINPAGFKPTPTKFGIDKGYFTQFPALPHDHISLIDFLCCHHHWWIFLSYQLKDFFLLT